MRLHREFYGRGPLNFKLYVVDDIIVIKYKGVLSESEKQIAETSDGAEMIKNIRRRGFDINLDKLKFEVENFLNTKILNVFTDILPKDDEKVTVFTFTENLV